MKASLKISAESFRRLVGENSPIAVTAHVHPDGDAVGSCVAMVSFLRTLGKKADIVLPGAADANMRFLTETAGAIIFPEEPERGLAAIRGAGMLICLDCNGFDRTGDLERPLRESKAVKVLIDHHIGPQEQDFALTVSECAISSASELLFWLLMEMPEISSDARRLPPEAALALMTGMTTDTNNFANSVYPSTFEMASRLIAAGVDRDALLGRLYNSYRENRLRAMGWMLSEAMTITRKGVAYTIFTDSDRARFGLEDGETEGFVNLPLAIGGVKMSILAKMDKDHYRISIRSKKGTSANRCSVKYFNGGGHECASGGKLFAGKDIPSCSRADVAAYIERVTDEFME